MENWYSITKKIKNHQQFDMEDFLRKVVKQGISDIHLKIDMPPLIRKNGLIAKTALPILSQSDMDEIIKKIVPDHFRSRIEDVFDFDFSIQIADVARFRVNLCHELGNIGFVLRVISHKIPSLNTLNLPTALEQFTLFNSGLVLVTGPTGSGKSTTIASMLNHINQNCQKHIITLEDPIEYLFTSKKSLFTQRQIGVDVDSFANGVKYALRQDPDVIFVGEMRDRETIMSALKAAETGHLVFSTLHTNDTVQTINRIINAFEPQDREPLRLQIAEILKGVISQKLLCRTDREGRIPASEVLLVTPAVRNYIIKDEIDSVYDLIKSGAYSGMIEMNMSLFKLVNTNMVSKEEALQVSSAPVELEQMFKGAFHGTVDIDNQF